MGIRIIFSGQVQGVFFRATTKEIADRLKLTGFVRNLPDGTVELVASGSGEALSKLEDTLLKKFHCRVAKRETLPSTERLTHFEIRRNLGNL